MAAAADFRSDTLTRPGPAMRQAMAEAEVGDDVFGEDPTVRRLEEAGAAFLGQPAALYLPSGTMANQVAIHTWCRPGDEVICEERSHVFYFEGGGMARLSGVQARTLHAPSGFPTVEQIEGACRPDDPHYPRSRLLVLENSHNMAGGRVLDGAGLRGRAKAARERGLRVHVDGARLANAAVALGMPAAELGAAVDSLTLCLSKGLGAPVGSLLAGGESFIAEARRTRKAFGGGMRQAGCIAAAGLLALEQGPAGLAIDHARAQELASSVAGIDGFDVGPVDTNIVMVDTPGPAAALARWLRDEHAVLALPVADRRLRFVLHRDLDDQAVPRALAALRASTDAFDISTSESP